MRRLTSIDGNGSVIGKRFELKSEEWDAQFEAEKDGEGWVLIEKGRLDEMKRIEFREGSCSYQDKTCPFWRKL